MSNDTQPSAVKPGTGRRLVPARARDIVPGSLTVQGNQAARTRALLRLLEDHDLPTVSNWDIADVSGRLSGLVMADADDPDGTRQRAAVTTWAAFLDSAVTEKTVRGRTELSAEGWAYGVRVRIWARIRPATTKEAAA
jgi:hypothetical protein